MRVTIVPTPPIAGGFSELDNNRHGFAEYFASILETEDRFSGVVLDVGCGSEGPTTLNHRRENLFRPLLARSRQLDGLDPGPDVNKHPGLTNRWHSTLEDAPLEASSYDLIISFNVFEHVADPNRFLSAVARALKSDGVVWAMTPHGNHPFAWGVKLLEGLRLKTLVGGDYEGLNRIPTPYRLNTVRAITRAAAHAGFTEATFYYYPALQWELYFPRPLRFIPRLYDLLIGTRFQSCFQQVLVKLERR
jgi:SAM-dependent methyltransferase